MLRLRLLILVLLVLLPALALVWRGSFVQQKMEIRAVRQNVLATARLAASSQEYLLRHSQRLLATVSKFQFLTLATSRPFCEWRLGNLLLLQPDHADFGLVEIDGDLFCTALKTNVLNLWKPILLSRRLREQTCALEETPGGPMRTSSKHEHTKPMSALRQSCAFKGSSSPTVPPAKLLLLDLAYDRR